MERERKGGAAQIQTTVGEWVIITPSVNAFLAFTAELTAQHNQSNMLKNWDFFKATSAVWMRNDVKQTSCVDVQRQQLASTVCVSP